MAVGNRHPTANDDYKGYIMLTVVVYYSVISEYYIAVLENGEPLQIILECPLRKRYIIWGPCE